MPVEHTTIGNRQRYKCLLYPFFEPCTKIIDCVKNIIWLQCFNRSGSAVSAHAAATIGIPAFCWQ